MATDLPLRRAYEFKTGKLVTTAFNLYDPLSVAGDSLTAKQWHLTRLGDMDSVWADFTGKGVHVGMYDSGVDVKHWDLAGNYDSSLEVTIGGQQISGAADGDSHGTATSGLVAAEKNGKGGVGVAYEASITSAAILTLGGNAISINGNAQGYLDAFRQAADLFDVTNNSYGPSVLFLPLASMNSRGTAGNGASITAEIMDYHAKYGRDGLGTVDVWAAGNSGSLGQAIGYSSDRHAVTVSAYREVDGSSSYYSEYGPHILVSAPSNDFGVLGGTGQVTTVPTNGVSYEEGGASSGYTDQFGGTSGAAPIVAGTIALMLDANENLGWRDVRNILAASAKMPVAFETGQTAVRYEAPDGSINNTALNEDVFHLNGKSAGWNGGAMHYSNDYGYGAVDAYNAVRMAEVWSLFGAAKTSANEQHLTFRSDLNLRIDSASLSDPYNGLFSTMRDFINAPVKVSFELGENIDIEHLDLSFNFDALTTSNYAYAAPDEISKVRMGLTSTQFKLTAPDGTSSFVTARAGVPDGELKTVDDEFTFGFTGFHGVESKGTWTLEFAGFKDRLLVGNFFPFNIVADVLIQSMKMDVYGASATSDDVYTYTNEFFTMASIAGETSRTTLSDTNGGVDWINAAAVSSDIKLSLVAGQATSFDGERAFALSRDSVIEGAVTGDGNDTLIGNRFDNKLFGMRGDDTLNGGAGDDMLFGGTGNDRFLFDNRGTSGRDTVLDWSRGDLIGTQTALRGMGTDGTVKVASNAQLLLDGTASGDKLKLSENGGAVLQQMGQSGGYFWYAYISGADLDSNDVIHEAGYQPSRVAAGAVAAFAASVDFDHALGNAGVSTTGTTGAQESFYLYDAMASTMSGGVQLYA
ncbi:MAG: S8 family serine peptidase [Sphingomonas phyllosphaerae]